ncbi:MAG: hypothetical protein RLZZ440_2408 [Planctomycetota bacterium]|jgi:hypothetical protein
MTARSIAGCPAALLAAVLITASASADTIWMYDFGQTTGVFTSGESTSFLPAPPADGGTARVRVGTGGGQFALVNPGSGSVLEATAPSSTSVNKFSIDGFAGTELFTLDMSLEFTGGASGSWYLLAGNGGSFANNNSFATAETFAGLRWNFGSEGSLATTRLSSSGSWLTTNVPLLVQDTAYQLTIYGNNSAAAVAYAGGTLAANSWDLWVDGSLAHSGLAKAGLPDGTSIDAFMFNGLNSTGNVATLTVDSLAYANHPVPEPGLQAVLGALILAGAVPARACRRNRRGRPRPA